MAVGDIRNSSLYMTPLVGKVNKLYAQKPTDGTGDFTFTGSAVHEINSAGNSVAVALNMPRLDFLGKYVAPADTSYYSYNGTSDNMYVPVSARTNLSGKFSFNFHTDNITSAVTTLGSNRVGGSGYQFSCSNAEIKFYWSDGTNTVNGNVVTTVASKDVIGYVIENAVNVKVYKNGVLINTVDISSVTGSPASNQNLYIGTTNTPSGFTVFDMYRVRADNRLLSTSEMLNETNGVAIDDKYKGATNSSYTAGVFTIDKNYKITSIGTTDFTLIGASANTVGLEFKATGVGSGTGTAISTGTVILLDGGKTTANWYDKTHSDKTTINGVTLNNPNNFTNEVHPLLTCPVLPLTYAFTEYTGSTSTVGTKPVINLTVGNKYNIEIKGAGLYKVEETGGNGQGGYITEVDSFTYTATQTSIVLTLISGTPDWIQVTDAPFALGSLIANDTGVSFAKVTDLINLSGLQVNGLLAPTEGSWYVKFGECDISKATASLEFLQIGLVSGSAFADKISFFTEGDDTFGIDYYTFQEDTGVNLSNAKVLITWDSTQAIITVNGADISTLITPPKAIDYYRSIIPADSAIKIEKTWCRNSYISSATERITLTT